MRKIVLLIVFAALLIASSASAYDLSNGLISYYSFDTDLSDDHSFRDFTNRSGGAGNQPNGCILGKCLDFENDESDCIDAGNTFNVGTSGFVVSFWADVESTQNYDAYFYKGDTGTQGMWFTRMDNPSTNHRAATYDGGWNRATSASTSVNLAHIVMVRNSSDHIESYYNNVLVAVGDAGSGNLADIDFSLPFRIGCGTPDGTSDANFYDGTIDEFGVWANISIDQADTLDIVSQLYNGGSGINYSTIMGGVPPAASADIDVLTTPSLNFSDFRYLFSEGENIVGHINYSDNALPITGAACELNWSNATADDDFSDDNFTICQGGCDFVTYAHNASFGTNLSLIQHNFHANMCRESPSSPDATVSICGNIYTIQKEIMPVCSSGTALVTVNTTKCNNRTYFWVNVTGNGANSAQAVRVEGGSVDAVFSTLSMTTGACCVTYNATSKYYQSSDVEYYDVGVYPFSAHCENGTSDFDASFSGNVTVFGAAPLIFLNDIVFSDGSFDTFDGSHEYVSGEWDFDVTVIDSNLFNVTITLSNATAQINRTTNLFSFDLVQNEEAFRDFGNPYNLTIDAYDDEGNLSSTQYLFNVTDTHAPSCVGFSDSIVENNTAYAWSATCTDESFFSFNITCDNGFSFHEEGLNVQAYAFTNSTIITSDTVCYVEVWDGHTAQELSSVVKDYTIPAGVEVWGHAGKNKLTAWTDAETVIVEKERLTDKISFSFDYGKLPPKTRYFHYSTSPDSYYFPSEKYHAWIVDAKTKLALDLNLKEGKAEYSVERLNSTTWLIGVTSVEEKLLFNSIVELNNASYTQQLNVTLITSDTLKVNECPDTIPSAMMLGIMFLVSVIFIGYGLFARGGSMFGLFGCLMLMVLSWVMANCQGTYAYIMVAISIVGIMFFAFRKEQGGILG